jgi:glycerol-3-phosphate O-acyltransferase
MSREQILRYTRALYPYLQAELFIRWSLEELDAVIDQWLEAFVEQGLLRFENDVYLRPAPSSRQFVLLTLLSKSIAQTLQRFYMTVSLLLNSGQNSISAEELEDLCTVMAQRLSILHGLNAPEFFDKSLFRHFIQTLLDLDVLRATQPASWAITNCSANWRRRSQARVAGGDSLSIRQVALHRVKMRSWLRRSDQIAEARTSSPLLNRWSNPSTVSHRAISVHLSVNARHSVKCL